jgi:hypothetical protein
VPVIKATFPANRPLIALSPCFPLYVRSVLVSSFTLAKMQETEASGSKRLPEIAGHLARRQIDPEQVGVGRIRYGPGALARDSCDD